MKRLAATVILFSTLLFSAMHSGAIGGFAHAMHGSMDAAADCMMASCPTDGATSSGDCVAHCIAAAASERNVVPPFAVSFVLAFVAFLALSVVRPLAAAASASCDRTIATLLLHQRLSTVVLRN